MTSEPTIHRVYKSINRPLTIWGAERRLFFLAMVVGAATFNFFGNLVGGVVMFAALYALRSLGDGYRPADSADLAQLVEVQGLLRPGQTGGPPG